MSLSINVYIRGPDGRMDILRPEEHAQELAGFESYRQRLYGSRAARALGLRLLPTLDGGDLFAERAEVARLRAEAEVALANLEMFIPESGASAESLRPRFENIIAAAVRAEEVGGGVVIW